MNPQTHVLIFNARRASLMPVSESARRRGKTGRRRRNETRRRSTAAPALQLTANALQLIHSEPEARYLVETDPRFAGYRHWLSSDYLLQALSLDPAHLQKRLGDGFYEQRLIAEQVSQLTGRRFLDGYASDEAQYQALMDAGLTYANEWRLIPGVGLTAAQMAQLTTDIIWLVEQTVTLPDGSTQKALVPQVYACVREGNLEPGGALIPLFH
jgi:filamentous hemagglutinin